MSNTHIKPLVKVSPNKEGQALHETKIDTDMSGCGAEKHDKQSIEKRINPQLEKYGDPFMMVDHEFKVSFINARAEQLISRKRKDVLGQNVFEELDIAPGSEAEKCFKEVESSGKSVIFETFFAPLWIHLEARVYNCASGLVIYLSDITERKKVEVELIESERRFKVLAKATADAVWDWDLTTNTVWWGDGMRALFGMTADKVTSKAASDIEHWRDRVHPEDRDRVSKSLERVIRSDQERWNDEYRFMRSNGTYARVVARGYVIRDNEGEAVRMAGGLSDKTDELQSRDELKRANRALLLRSSISQEVVRARSEEDLLLRACVSATEKGGYRMAWVGYAEQSSGKPINIKYSSCDPSDQGYVDQLKISWDENVEAGRGPAGESIRAGEPIVLAEITERLKGATWGPAAKARGFRGVAWLPLMEKGVAFGVLCLYSKGPNEEDEAELQLLQGLADDIAYGVIAQRAKREAERLQSAVLKVASGVSGRGGSAFFDRLTKDMADMMGARCVIVSKRRAKELGTAIATSMYADGEHKESFEYPLESSPMALVYEKSEASSDRLQELYPDSRLTKMGLTYFMAARLDNAHGEGVGTLCVGFNEKPYNEEELIRSMLKIFAARASSELERLDADSVIRDQAALLDKAQDAIIERCEQGRIQFWSKGAERLYGWSSEEVVGRNLHDLLDCHIEEWGVAQRETRTNGEWIGELNQKTKNGQNIVVQSRWSWVRNEQGASSILEINTDITQKKDAQKEIENLALYDTLTGLPNRLRLLEKMREAMSMAAEEKKMGAVLFIDLDNFKTLNDTMGHDKGDALLKAVGTRLSGCIAKTDTIGRAGGDEFVIVLSDLSYDETEAMTQAQSIAERVLSQCTKPFMLGDFECHSGASVGVAMFNGEDKNVGEVLKKADVAMYQAKENGRNTVKFFDPKIQEALAQQAIMEADMRQSIKEGHFELHYQPQIDQFGRVYGAEALARWRHPTRGMVSPAQFIPLAEDTGLMVPLGHYVMDKACEQLSTWSHCEKAAELVLAVNVSMLQFRRPDFVEEVKSLIKKHHINPKRLKLELTESMLADNVEDTIKKMSALKEIGVSFSLDDFGTGYSSLSYLKRLPLDQLKIDQSFVRDVLSDPNDAAIAKTVVALGQSLGLAVIAEGVETENQRQFLEDNGCLTYQGYLFSKPLPTQAFDEFLAARESVPKS